MRSERVNWKSFSQDELTCLLSKYICKPFVKRVANCIIDSSFIRNISKKLLRRSFGLKLYSFKINFLRVSNVSSFVKAIANFLHLVFRKGVTTAICKSGSISYDLKINSTFLKKEIQPCKSFG